MEKEDFILAKAQYVSELKTADQAIEDAEVVLSNLLALINTDNEIFKIPFDDVIVTISLAIRLLGKYREHQLNLYFTDVVSN